MCPRPESKCMRGKRAFTLVELMVVISIIAILVAILMPSFKRVMLQAKSVSCFANVREIGRAVQSYATANNQYVLRDHDLQGGTHYPWVGRYAKYFGKEVTASDTDAAAIADQVRSVKAYQCPAVDKPDFPVHYVVNAIDFVAGQAGTSMWGQGGPSMLTAAPKPIEKLLYLIDANFPMANYAMDCMDFWRESEMTYVGAVANSDPRMIQAGDGRHLGFANGLFFDGHVAKLKLDTTDLGTTVYNPYFR